MDKIIRIIDVETTGLSPTDEIVEIAAVDWTPEGSRTHLSTLVKPSGVIPATASAVHHISAEDVEDAPSRSEVIPDLLGAPIYAAFNAPFDKSLLSELDGALWICLRKVALRAVVDAPAYGLQVLRYHLALEAPPDEAGQVAHRALYDAWTAERLLSFLYKVGWTAREMVKISREPALLRRIPIGKHYGKTFEEIDDGWLDWAVQNVDDPEISYTAAQELKRRRGELVA